jgi:hypothetical protein
MMGEIVTRSGAATASFDPFSIERSVPRPLKEDVCQMRQ